MRAGRPWLLPRELLALKRASMAIRRERRDDDASKPSLDALHELDLKHIDRLKAILKQHGWPGRSLVGEDGAHAAALIAQQAGEDVAFQRHCLEAMDRAAAGEVAPLDLACLTDRVLLNEGKKQRYGTQYRRRGDKVALLAIDDRDHVDDRRKTLGLPPLADYRKQLEARVAAPADSS